MKSLYRVALVSIFLCCSLRAYAQDSSQNRSRPFNPVESALVDSMRQDVGVVMPDSVLRSSVFGNQCQQSYLYRLSESSPPAVYSDVCVRRISSDSGEIRLRYIDVRPGKPRITLVVVMIFQARQDSVVNKTCKIWLDEGFAAELEPNGVFRSQTETVCGENRNRIIDLLNAILANTH